jgi:hypothetical protein
MLEEGRLINYFNIHKMHMKMHVLIFPFISMQMKRGKENINNMAHVNFHFHIHVGGQGKILK